MILCWFRKSFLLLLVGCVCIFAPLLSTVGATADSTDVTDDDDDDTVQFFHQHVGTVTLNDESFYQAVSPKKSNWLILFHTTAAVNATILTGQVPSLSELKGITLATVNVERDGPLLTERLQISPPETPVFVCFQGHYYYPYTSVEDYSWPALLAFCRHPPSAAKKSLPPRPSTWEHVKIKLGRHWTLQLAAVVVVGVSTLLASALVGHFGGRRPAVGSGGRHHKVH